MRGLWLACALLIVYGSLYPFDFAAGPAVGLATLLVDSLAAPVDAGDALANVLLFAPLGLLGQWAVHPGGPWRDGAGHVVAGLLLAVAVQLAQVWLPSRDPSLVDVIGNGAGLAAGTLLAHLAPRLPGAAAARAIERVPLLLFGAWIAYRLFPFVPSVDLQNLKDSLKPLLLDPQFGALETVHNAVGWLVAVRLLADVGVVRAGAVRVAAVAVVGATLALEAVIVNNVVTLPNVAGAGCALLAVAAGLHGRPALLAGVLTVDVVVRALAPFELAAAVQDFHWVPFWGFLHGSLYVNAQVLIEKAFLYGALVYLWRGHRAGVVAPTIMVALIIGMVEAAQVFVAGHTPAITDVVLVLLLGTVLRVVRGGIAPSAAPGAGSRPMPGRTSPPSGVPPAPRTPAGSA